MGTRIGHGDPWTSWSGLRFSSIDLVVSDVEAAVASVGDV